MTAMRKSKKDAGEHIADIGCGGGYFSWQFAKLVGEKGKVYATEINKDALNFLDNFIRDYNVKNIETVITKMNDAGLRADTVDTIFMCSMYHAVYITNIGDFARVNEVYSRYFEKDCTVSFLIYFTSIFGGGMIPWYLMYANVLGLKGSTLAIWFPALMSPFLVILMRPGCYYRA